MNQAQLTLDRRNSSGQVIQSYELIDYHLTPNAEFSAAGMYLGPSPGLFGAPVPIFTETNPVSRSGSILEFQRHSARDIVLNFVLVAGEYESSVDVILNEFSEFLDPVLDDSPIRMTYRNSLGRERWIEAYAIRGNAGLTIDYFTSLSARVSVVFRCPSPYWTERAINTGSDYESITVDADIPGIVFATIYDVRLGMTVPDRYSVLRINGTGTPPVAHFDIDLEGIAETWPVISFENGTDPGETTTAVIFDARTSRYAEIDVDSTHNYGFTLDTDPDTGSLTKKAGGSVDPLLKPRSVPFPFSDSRDVASALNHIVLGYSTTGTVEDGEWTVSYLRRYLTC